MQHFSFVFNCVYFLIVTVTAGMTINVCISAVVEIEGPANIF